MDFPSSVSSVIVEDNLWARLDDRSDLVLGGVASSPAVLLRFERRGPGDDLATFWRLEGGPSVGSSVASLPLASANKVLVATVAEDRSASLVSFVGGTDGVFDSPTALRLPAGSELARSCEPRGVGSEFRPAGLVDLLELAKSFLIASAVGGLI